MNVKELRIIVQPDKIGITRSVGSPETGNINREVIKLELSIAKIFHKVLNKFRVVSAFEKNDYEILGKTLFKVLFFDPLVKKFFLDELAEVRDSPDTYCRIYLHFKDLTGDIPELPWEYMLVEDVDRDISELYLAADSNQRFDLIRIVKENKISFTPKPDQKLNVALIVSNPRNQPEGRLPLDTDELSKCFNRLNQKFGNLINTNEREDEKPDFRNFESELADVITPFNGEPYVLHFYGHAQAKDKESMIAFTDENQNLAWISDKEFAAIFSQNTNIQKPQLIILQACESGQVCNANTEDPGGLAYALAMNNIPAIVAMQNIVREDVSIDFIEQFYTSLLNGEDVARAVTRGRQFLGCGIRRNGEKRKMNEYYDNNTFGTPLLFISTIQPIRLMPEKVSSTVEKQLVNKICPKCKTLWKNIKQDKEICTLNRCGGRLETYKEDTAIDNKNVSSNEARAALDSKLQGKPSLN
jgi:hypothetical protein